MPLPSDLTTVSHYYVRPTGGCQWVVTRHIAVIEDGETYQEHDSVGLIHFGEIDEDGQWSGDYDDALDNGIIPEDGLPVYVDGVLVRPAAAQSAA